MRHRKVWVLKISDYFEKLKKIFLNFLDQKIFCVQNFKHLLISLPKCIDLNS